MFDPHRGMLGYHLDMMRTSFTPTLKRTQSREFVLVCLLAFAVVGCTKVVPRDTVVLYTSADQEYAEQIIAAFEDQYPDITARARYDTEATKTTGLVERLRAESANPQADVFWSSEPFLTNKLADEGLLATLELPDLADWPSEFRDAQRRWFGFACRARIIAYSPDRVTDPPANWLDLTDERFKNRIVMADPNFGTTRGHIASLFTLWGNDKAEQYLRDLKANGIRIVTSNSQAVRDVASGLADLAITDSDDAWAAQRNGYKIEFIYPRHGTLPGQGTLLIPNTVGLIADRPDNPAALTFIEFLLGPEAQRILHESDSHNLPILPPGTDLGITIDDRYRIDDPFKPDIRSVSNAMPHAIATANRILLSRDH